MHKLTGNDATVIRGGFAIAYDPAFYNILSNIANTAPQTLLANVSGATAAGLGIPSMAGADIRAKATSSGLLPKGQLNPAFLSQSGVSPNFHSPYSEQWSLGVQRQIDRNNVFEVRYIGNRGIGLFQTIDVNPIVSTLVNGFTRDTQGVTVVYPSFKNLLPAGVTPQTATTCPDDPRTPTANESTIALNRAVCGGPKTLRANTGRSWFDSLQMRYAGRLLKNRLTVGATYTFGKTLDNTSEIFAFTSENSVLSQNPYDYLDGEKGISNLHRKHLISANFIYDVPFKREQHGVLGHLLGGFQVNGNYVYNSARPYTPSQSFNSAFFTSGANSYLSTTAIDPLRPFLGSPNAPVSALGINQVDAARIFGSPLTNVNGFLSLNELNNGNVVPVTTNDVRFIFNGPGAARVFGTPFGNVPRNYLRSIPIDQINLGLFKNTKIGENINLQFRAEFFNVLNHPQAGFGITRQVQLPDVNVDNAGISFADNTQIEKSRRVVQFGLRLVF
jgi:hypothetical protein